MNKEIYLSPPHLSGDELEYLRDAVESNWIAPVGPHVDAFERELGQVLGVPHVLTVNSGTSAIHLGLLALGVSQGHEVVCPTLTFCATVNPVVYCGATPVFVESEKDTWNMDPAILEEAIRDRIAKTGAKPRCIIVVHLYGMPAKMNELMAVANRYQIPVLEDAAESFGSLYFGKAPGTLGAIGLLSFNGNKIITTSGGGALFSSDAALIEKARYYRQEAKEPLPYYEHRAVGYNYRMSNLLAALGRSQLQVLGDRVLKRRAIFHYYFHAMNNIYPVAFQPEPEGSYANRWLTAIIVRSDKEGAESIRLALAAAKIESRPLWKPMHMQPVFKHAPYYGGGLSQVLFEAGLCLPSGSSLSEGDLERIVHIVKRGLGRKI